jgi:hypothetical protein
MNRYEKAKRLHDGDFKQTIGVAKAAFDAMADIFISAYPEKHKRRGRHAKLPVQGQLFMGLKYWCQYLTQKELAYEKVWIGKKIM